MCSSTPYTVSIVLLWSSYSHLTNRHSTVIGRVHLYPFTSLVDVKMNITSILQCNFVFSLPSTEMSVHLASFFICSPSPVSPLSRLLSCTPLIFRCLPLSFLTPEMLSVLTGGAAGETDRLECQAAGMLWVEEGEKNYIYIYTFAFSLWRFLSGLLISSRDIHSKMKVFPSGKGSAPNSTRMPASILVVIFNV